MNIIKQHFTRWHLAASLLVVPLLAQSLLPSLVDAGTFTKTQVRFDRMKISTATTGTVCFAPTVTTAISSVKVTFPTGYSLAAVGASNWRVNTTNLSWPSGASGLTNVNTADDVTGQAVRFPLSSSFTPTAGNLYCFNWTDASATQPGTQASDESGTVASYSDVSASTQIDSGTYSTATVNDDQIAVSASVNATFSFDLDSNSATLGTLSPGTAKDAGPINATVSTNSAGGWQMWAADANGSGATNALYSTAAAHKIDYSPAAGQAAGAISASEGYNFRTNSISGTTCGTPTYGNFNTATQFNGSGLNGSLSSVVSVTGAADACALDMYVNAKASATTPAATDYSGLITVVAAGTF